MKYKKYELWWATFKTMLTLKPMYAQVQIFTITGKLIQTLEQNILNEGFRSSSITWDGLDAFGDQIGRGVYVYKLRVRAENMSVAEKIQKLVILR